MNVVSVLAGIIALPMAAAAAPSGISRMEGRCHPFRFTLMNCMHGSIAPILC